MAPDLRCVRRMRSSFASVVTVTVGSLLALSAVGCVENAQDGEFPVAEGVIYTTSADHDRDHARRRPTERAGRHTEDVEVFANQQPDKPFVSTGVLFTWSYSNARSVERLRERAALAGLDGIYWVDCTSRATGLCTAKGFVYAHAEVDALPVAPQPKVTPPTQCARSASPAPQRGAPPSAEEKAPRGVIAPSGDAGPFGDDAAAVGAPTSK